MSDRVKITELTELVTAEADDLVVVVDVSDTTDGAQGTTKKAKKSEIKGLDWKGAWAAGTYQIDDAVTHNNSSFIATAVTTEEPSLTATDWDVLARGPQITTPTGTVDGANDTFTVTEEPMYVVSDNMIYFAGAGYTYAALQIVMDIPPSSSIRAII